MKYLLIGILAILWISTTWVVQQHDFWAACGMAALGILMVKVWSEHENDLERYR